VPVFHLVAPAVESLQSRLFRKLGTGTRAQALAVAYGLGLVPLTECEDSPADGERALCNN
jgi:hypothetical protein